MAKSIDGRILLPSVILSEPKELAQVLASHMVLCVISTSIVAFLAPLGMTKGRAFARKF